MTLFGLTETELLVYYKVLRLGLLVVILYIIIWFLYKTKYGEKAEDIKNRVMEED